MKRDIQYMPQGMEDMQRAGMDREIDSLSTERWDDLM